MITRDIGAVEVIAAFDAKTFQSSVSASTGELGPGVGYSSGQMETAFSDAFSGRMIDRGGLARGYQSVKVVAGGHGYAVACSTGTTYQYFGLKVGLQHASGTGGSWQDYSTADWSAERAAWFLGTATSTNAPFYNATRERNQGYMTTSTAVNTVSDSISTGLIFANASANFDLTSAKQFIRMIVKPTLTTTGGCGGPVVVVAGSLVFGDPNEAPPAYASNGRIYVTSGPSTSTTT